MGSSSPFLNPQSQVMGLAVPWGSCPACRWAAGRNFSVNVGVLMSSQSPPEPPRSPRNDLVIAGSLSQIMFCMKLGGGLLPAYAAC